MGPVALGAWDGLLVGTVLLCSALGSHRQAVSMEGRAGAGQRETIGPLPSHRIGGLN